jgi:hypothetical protein
MKTFILDATQSENIPYIHSLFDAENIIALDTTASVFQSINEQLDIPENYIQGFTMTPQGHLYYYKPAHIDTEKADAFLIDLQSKL